MGYYEPYNPTPEEIEELDQLRALDPDPDPVPENPLPVSYKQYAGWSRACMAKARPEDHEQSEQDRYLEHLKCRGLTRRSCVCTCHPENRIQESVLSYENVEGGDTLATCPLCGGSGIVVLPATDNPLDVPVEIECPECFGSPGFFCVVYRSSSAVQPEPVFGYVHVESPNKAIEHILATHQPEEPIHEIMVYAKLGAYLQGMEPLARWKAR